MGKWMRGVGIVAISLLGVAACGDSDDVCDKAADKGRECGLDANRSDSASCNAHDSCLAQCILDTDCDTLKALFDSGGTLTLPLSPEMTELTTCVDACPD